jgi:hypothetical protein
MAYRKSKYHSQKVEIDGILFDSKREANRYRVLKEKAEMGQITSLERQVKFLLIPKQAEPDTVGPRGGIKKGKILEKECSYIADFVYIDENGERIVEDTKGFRTPDYVIKRKLMLWLHGIRIHEI